MEEHYITALSQRRPNLIEKHTGISRQTIYNIIHGKHKPRQETVDKLVDYLTGDCA